MKKQHLLALLTATLIFSACQKEDTVTENAAGKITSAAESVSDMVETSGTSAEISEIVSSKKVTEHTTSESGTELAEESAETEEIADEKLLQKALRNAGDVDKYAVGRIFIDLNFDGFPEMISCGEYGTRYLCTFDMETGEWSLCTSISDKLYLYNDKESGEHFYFFIGYVESDGSPTVDGIKLYSDNRFVCVSLGDIDSYSCRDCGKVVAFQHTNGIFAMSEFDDYSHEEITEFIYSTAEKGLEEYTLEKIIDFNEITAGVDRSQKFEIFAEDFSDEPQENGLPKYVNDENEYWWLLDCQAFLDASDMSEEAFAKLAENKKLTCLLISVQDENEDSVTLDFTGIGRLENLKELVIYSNAKNFINADEIGKLKNLEALYISSELDNYDFLSELDSLKIIQFGNTNDKPADFFKPIYGMKNLRYMPVSTWDPNITTEQVKELEKNMPQLCICYYKRG